MFELLVVLLLVVEIPEVLLPGSDDDVGISDQTGEGLKIYYLCPSLINIH